MKPKDLLGIPWMVAFALRADGWYLRAENIWAKGISCCDEYAGSCMPESVTDRTTKSHETVFLLTKNADYFYDSQAVKERRNDDSMARDKRGVGVHKNSNGAPGQTPHSMADERSNDPNREPESSRNLRSVWAINPEPTKLAHFATMPTRLVKLCLMAGTSAKGACGDCGAPWERVIEYRANYTKRENAYAPNSTNSKVDSSGWSQPDIKTIGWQPTCECHGTRTLETVTLPARMSKDAAGLWGADSNGEYNGQSQKDHPDDVQDASALKARIIKNATEDREVKRWVYRSEIPLDKHPIQRCSVLDPFGGSGTTGQVALELGLACTLLELNPDYIPLIDQRTNVTPGFSFT